MCCSASSAPSSAPLPAPRVTPLKNCCKCTACPCALIDTAGLRTSSDEIEQHGIARTGKEIGRADLMIEVVDATRPATEVQRVGSDLEPARRILVLNKADLGVHPSWADGIAVSCVTSDGIELLRGRIRDIVMQHSGQMALDHPVAINARHQACFQRVATSLDACRESLLRQDAPEFTALEAREAMQALGDVTGQVDIEEVLDVVFSSFCIGK